MVRLRWVVALYLTAAGCGGDDDDDVAAGDGDADADVDGDGDGDGDGDADGDGDGDADGDGDGDADGDADADADGDGDGDADGDADDPAAEGPLNALRERITLERDEGGLFGFSTEVSVFLADGLDVPAPAIVFLHGFSLSGAQYESYARHLASHGFVTAVPESMSDFGTDHVTYAARLGALLDLLVAENAREGSPLFGRIDPDQLGVTGHSLGGKVALLQAADDARIAATLTLDPVDAIPPLGGDGYVSVAPERMADVLVPVGVVGTGRGGEAGFAGQACAPADENFEQFYAAASAPRVSLEILEAGHNQFLDDPACPQCGACVAGELADDVVRTYARRALRAFYEHFLRGDDSFLPWLYGEDGDTDDIVFAHEE